MSQEIIEALQKGDIKKIQDLLKKKNPPININFKGEDGIGIIHAAAVYATPEIFELLLSQPDLQIDLKDSRGNTALFWAIYTGNLNFVQKLLAKGANPNQINSTGETPLAMAKEYGQAKIVQLLSPISKTPISKKGRESKEEEKKADEEEALNNIHSILRTGHVLGLSGKIPLSLPDGSISLIPTEGAFSLDSIKILNDIVDTYSKTIPVESPLQKHFNIVKKAFKKEARFLEYDGSETAKSLFGSFQDDQEVTVLPTGWQNHDVTVVFYKNKMILSNRGRGGKEGQGYDTSIYELSKEDLEKLEPKYFESLRPPGTRSMEDMMPLIMKYATSDRLKAKIPSKEQAHGTCSFVNAKSSIKGILYLLKLEELQQDKSKSTSEIEKEAIEYSVKEYKKFTTFMRDQEINNLIEKLNSLKTGEERQRKLILDLLTEYIFAHHGQEKAISKNRRPKILSELNRVRNILTALSKSERKFMNEKLESRGVWLMLEVKSAAIRYGSEDWSSFLLENGQNIHATLKTTGKNQNSILFTAAIQGMHEVLEALLTDEAFMKKIDVKDGNGNTLIKQAVINGHPETVRTLIKLGADTSLTDKGGFTPLGRAILKSNITMIKTLMAEDAVDKNGLDEMSNSPIMVAVAHGRKELVPLLVALGADINFRDPNGKTVFMKMIGSSANIPCLKILLENGADPNIEDNEGFSPLSRSRQADPKVTEFLLSQRSVNKSTLSMTLQYASKTATKEIPNKDIPKLIQSGDKPKFP